MRALKRISELFMLGMICTGLAQAAEKSTWIDPVKAKAENADFAIQGEYGQATPGAAWGLQVIAMGAGKFDAYLLEGGLPGLGWERGKKRIKLTGAGTGASIILKDKNSTLVTIANSSAAVIVGGASHELPRIERRSPTINAKAPKDAIVLFDGKTADAWKNGKMDGKLLENTNATSKQLFGSYKLHLEFRTPYKPFARGQGRGNSGVYHQGRYETQVLDSFGLEGRMNETGGIYSIAAPKTNACLPPLTWQTYDVDFVNAQWKNGKKIKNANITVRLNGILIHENQALTHSTASSPLKEADAPGPIFLQHHGNPVRYRNIWITETAATANISKAKIINMEILHGQLRYDKEIFSVTPGEKVSIVFHNNDEMQHNIVICKPGTNTNALGMAAIALGVDGIKKQYIPDSKEILHHTPMVEPGDTYTLTFTAPIKTGTYPYVCTFPGHFNIMKGKMVVANKTESALTGLKESFYKGKWQKLPDFSKLTPTKTRTVSTNLMSLESGEKIGDNFGLVFEGKFQAKQKGNHTFTIAGDDGIRLIINGKKLLEDDGLHPMRSKTGQLNLAAGAHDFRLEYFNGTGGRGLAASVAGPGRPKIDLTKKAAPAAKKNNKPKITFKIGETVEIYRTGLDLGGKKPHAVCIGFPNGTSCAFDAATCRLIGAWHGGFVDPTSDWTGRGGNGSKTIGTIFIQPDNAAPIPAIDGQGAKPVFDGYRVDNNDVIFLYTLGNLKVSQRLHSPPDTSGLHMTISATGAAGETVRWPMPKTNNIKLNGAAISNGALQAKVTDSSSIKIQVKQ